MLWIRSGVFYVLFISSFSIIRAQQNSDEELQCRDENDRPVDWYVLYKIPKVRESGNALIRKGLSYMYITSETVATGWKLSKKDMTLKTTIAGNTLASLYKDSVASGLMWVMYNDAPPDGNTNGKYGHAKGVVMANGKRGIWLIHSVPGYPPIPRSGESPQRRRSSIGDNSDSVDKINNEPEGEYDYPESGRINGQSFMCITMNADQIDTVARQLMYNQIVVYRKNLPSTLSEKYPVFLNASNQMRIKNPPYNKKATIKSSGGVQFTSFAKSDKWQSDLYSDFVGPQLNSDLLVESWLNGAGRLPSKCKNPRVYNVESIKLEEANVVFKSSHDHSKWAVSSKNRTNGNWVCVGDINRADTQFSRGGGTVCLKSSNLWKYYKNAVNDVEPCPKIGFFQRVKSWFSFGR